MIISKRIARHGLAGREMLFTPDQARRALPYMSRLASDAAVAFGSARECRHALLDTREHRQVALLTTRRDDALERLNGVIDEANAVGADLFDIPRKIVRFHGLENGRRVTWLWAVGDPISDQWPHPQEAESASIHSHAAIA